MLNELFKYQNNPVRVVGSQDEPLFVAKDVCAVLSIRNHHQAINGRPGRNSEPGLDPDEKGVADVTTPSGIQKMTVINESGLFALIFKSKKDEAKTFRKWVTSEVLPTLRKTGRYDAAEASAASPEDMISDPDFIIRLANEVKTARHEAELSAKKVEALAPIAQFGQDMLDTEGLFTVTQVAKPLGTGAVTLNRFLEKHGIIRKHRDEWWPMHRYQNSGHFRIVAHQRTVYDSLTGEQQQRTFHQLKVTPKGRELIHRKWRESGHTTPAAPLKAMVT